MSLFFYVNSGFGCGILGDLRVAHILFRRIRSDYFNPSYLAGHVEHTGEMRTVYRLLVGKPEFYLWLI
jgi:hypothetical protein